jgi:hypothetical protein
MLLPSKVLSIEPPLAKVFFITNLVFKNNAATIVEVEYLDYGNRAKVKTS